MDLKCFAIAIVTAAVFLSSLCIYSELYRTWPLSTCLPTATSLPLSRKKMRKVSNPYNVKKCLPRMVSPVRM